MPQLTQGLIVAALIGLLLAVIVGYYLRQGRVNELTEALQQSQKRQEELEKEHEQRLRTATQQLQKDYEAHLAEKMEQYEDRLEERRGQLESEYRSRQSVMGGALADADSTTEQRIRKQYETRLKEAATKIQQAYEQHLQDKLVEARSQAQQDYDQRLAEAIAHYQDQEQTRQTQTPSELSLGALVPEPTAVASVGTGDLAEVEARLQAEYDQRLAEYEDDMAQRLSQMEQDYEARIQMAQASSLVPADLAPAVPAPSAAELELNLRRELEESLRVEYEQKLAEKIEHYQDELTQRTQELEQAYEARLQLQVAPFPEPAAPVADESAVDLDMAMLEEAMPPEAAIVDEAALIADSEISLDMNEFSSAVPSSAVDEEDTDLAAMLESETASGQVDDWGLEADSDSDSLNVDAFTTSEPGTISDLSELNFDDADEFSSEPTSTESAAGDFGLASLVESEADSGQIDDFGLEPEVDADSLHLNALLNDPASEPSSEFAVDEIATEAAPASDESDFGLASLLGDEAYSGQANDLGLDTDFSAESLDLNALLNEPVSEPSTEFAVDELAFGAAPTPDESNFGLAGLLENETAGGQVDEFSLDDSFSANSLDLNALLNEPVSEPSTEFALDEFAPETASSGLDEEEFGLAALLEGEADSGQVDEFSLDDDFNANDLDLDALLNPPAPKPTSDDLLDDLDDLSSLS